MNLSTTNLLRRLYAALLLVVFCSATALAAADNEVTINSPTANSTWVPCYLTYNNTRAEMIYTASQLSAIGNDNKIVSVAFDGITTAEIADIDFVLYVKETSATQVKADKADLSEFTKVFDGKGTIHASSTMQQYEEILHLDLDTPFEYTAGTNLHFVLFTHSSTKNAEIRFAYRSQTKASGISWWDDGKESEERPSLYVTNYSPVMRLGVKAIGEEDPVGDREPDIILHTNKKKGEHFGVVFHTLHSGIVVDYGDGVHWEYPFGGSLLVNNDVAGEVIKVWKYNKDDELQAIQAENNGITKVELNTPELQALYLRGNELTDGSISFEGCESLRIIDLSYNHFYNFTYSSDVLTKLILSHNDLQQLDIPSMPSLEHLDVSVNMLRSQAWIEWPKDAEGLTYLNLSYNMLYETPVELWPNLEQLIINNNNYDALDLSKNTHLKNIQAFYTGLSNLNVSKATELEELNVMATKSTKLDLAANTLLVKLDVSKNDFGSLDLSHNTGLKHLVMNDALLETFDFSALTQLEHLEFAENGIAQPRLSALTNLKYLDCSSNGIAQLDLAANTAIDTLICAVNKLAQLDLSALSALRWLDCSSNDIEGIDIKANTNLLYLNAYDNRLTALDVKGMKALCGLNIKNNRMQQGQLASLIMALPDVSSLEVAKADEAWKTVFAYAGNPGADGLDDTYVEVLDVKGWKAEVPHRLIADASAAFSVLPELINTRLVFALDCGKDKTIAVDWGDGKKVQYNVTGSSYQNLEHIVLGTNIRIYAPGATELGVANLGLTALDVSGMTMLNRLACSGNNINELDLTRNTELEYLVCGKGALSSLLFPADNKLLQLYCTKSLLRSIDLTTCPLIEDLDVNSNRLTSLDLTKCFNLTKLHAYGNELTSIDLSKSPMLLEVLLGYNKLTSLDVSANNSIQMLSVPYNCLTALDLSQNDYLTTIYCEHNNISDLRLNPTITTLLAGYNELESLDLTAVPELKELEVEHNKLRTIDLTAVPLLKRVWLANNGLEGITMSELTHCAIFNAPNNRMTSFDAAKVPYASELILNNNQLTGTLDLSANNSLQQLHVNNNHISKIVYPTKPSLVVLYAAYNKLSTFKLDCSNLYAVDLSNNNLIVASFAANPSLALLMLDYNQLASLNVEKNTKLIGLTLRANLLDTEELNTLYAQLPKAVSGPTEEYPWMGVLAVSGNPGAADSNVATATAKGWTVLYDEAVAEYRDITIRVTDAAGQSISGASIIMFVDDAPISITPEQTAEGVYVYENFPVITSEQYAVNVSATGFLPKTVVLDGIATGDVTIDVVLDVDPEGIGAINAESDAAAEIYDLGGVRVSRAAAPGIYIIRTASGKAVKRVVR